MYPANKSHVPHGLVTMKEPIAVINRGTAEYQQMGMEELVVSIKIQDLVNKYINLEAPKDPTRGNIHRFFGIAGCQNLGVAKTDKLILDYCGVTMPRVLEGSDHPDVCHALQVGWKIGKLAKVPFCQDSFLKDNTSYHRYFAFIQERLGGDSEHFMWASMAVCCLPLEEGSEVNAHHDKENDPILTTTLNVSWVVSLKEKWYRYSLIFYMRKSIHDMFIREAACRDAEELCATHLSKCAPYRLPVPPSADTQKYLEHAKTYYEEGVGSEGFLVTLDVASNRIVGLALISKPSCDKQAHYLGAVANAIFGLMRAPRIVVLEELIELLYVCGLLNGIYSFVNLLGALQTDWDQSRSRTCPGGLIQYMFERFVTSKGSVQSGVGLRCQPFLGNNLSVAQIQLSCLHLKTLMETWKSQKLQLDNASMKVTRLLTKDAITALSKHLHCVGAFSGHHIFHVAALLGMSGKAYLDYALVKDDFKSTTSAKSRAKYPGTTNSTPSIFTKPQSTKSVNKSPKMVKSTPNLTNLMSYVSSTSEEGDASRYSVVLTSVTRYLRTKLTLQGLTESMMENILCESKRKTKVYDLHFPGQPIFMRSKKPGSWIKVVPKLVGIGNLQYEYGGVLDTCNIGTDTDFHQQNLLWNETDKEKLKRLIPCKRPSTDGASNLQIELKIPASFLEQHSPNLIQVLRENMAEHSQCNNLHNDYMERLNSISELMRIISQWQDNTYTPKKRKAATQIPSPLSPPLPLQLWAPKPISPEPLPFVTAQWDTASQTTVSPGQPVAGRKSLRTKYRLGKRNAEPFVSGFLNFHPMYPPCPPDPNTVPWVPDMELCQNGIRVRHYKTETHAAAALIKENPATWPCQLESIYVIKQWHTLTNDVHAAICHQKCKSQRVFVDRIKIRKGVPPQGRVNAPEEGYITINEVQMNDENVWYHSVLEYLPILSEGGCYVKDAIAKTLGGKQSDVGGGWCFGTRDVATQHTLLCAICTIGNRPFYLDLVKRTRKDCGHATSIGQDGTYTIAGYVVEKMLPPITGYFLVVVDPVQKTEGQDVTPKLIIVFPSRTAGVQQKYVCVRLL
jgi:hypothetical protein